MLTVDLPTSQLNGRADDPVHGKIRKADSRSDDINDGIDGAHLMKMDLFDGSPMNGGFSFGKFCEDGDGSFLGTGWQAAFLYDGGNIAQIPVGRRSSVSAGFFIQPNSNLRAGDAMADLFFNNQRIAGKPQQFKL